MTPFPKWLHKQIPHQCNTQQTIAILEKNHVNTVCLEANCPNRWECYSKKTATFLVLGNQCTRNCAFCNVAHSPTPSPPDKDEPKNIAQALKDLGLKHVVITMVTRDDLNDGGASHIAHIIQEICACTPSVTIEVLTSDFKGNTQNLNTVLEQNPDIFNHNIETVCSLSQKIRPSADYLRSLQVLNYAKKTKKCSYVKSGLMLGLGETRNEVIQALTDLHQVGCDIVTIGQYLRPTHKNIAVKRYVSPQEFQEYEFLGSSIGIPIIYSGPFIRSSYNAEQIFNKLK